MKIRVLLVDDEKDYIDSLARQLEVRNFSVCSVYNGDAAVQSISREDFDVVLLDIMMPGIDGIQTYNKIKKIDPFIQVIMHTGHVKIDTAINGLKSGICDYVLKPVDIEELVEKIEFAYRQKSINEESR